MSAKFNEFRRVHDRRRWLAAKACSRPRVGITGVFTPPVTG